MAAKIVYRVSLDEAASARQRGSVSATSPCHVGRTERNASMRVSGKIVGLSILLCFVVAAGHVLGQAAAPADATAPAAASEPGSTPPAKVARTKTFWDVIKGGGVAMIPLGAASVAMVGLTILGFYSLRKRRLVRDEDVLQLRNLFSAGDYQAAIQYCKAKPGFLTNVVGCGLSVVGMGRDVCEKAMEDALSKEVAVLSTRFYYLNLIGVVTPMLGLTGTVLGMIKAFSTLGESGIGDPARLAGAIGEVLVATATGLFVAIPGFSFYYVFRNYIVEATAYCEDHANILFRGMPYEQMSGWWFGDELVYAAPPKELAATAEPQNA